MRLIVVEPDRPEIDLSSKYFKSQIMRLLNTCKKTIVIRVWLRRNYFIMAVYERFQIFDKMADDIPKGRLLPRIFQEKLLFRDHIHC